ncbi:Argininosuccinate synthase, partial [Phytophthora palmivora]
MSVQAQPGDKVVLAYSGGLDTSIILKWLTNKGFEVICYCANVGQHGEDYEKVRAKALSLGAKKVYIEDLREEFVKNYIFEAVKANAIYESRYLLGTSLARPVIAKKQVEIAQAEGAKYVAHGATGKGNDQVRFELCAQALDAHLKTIAPWRDAEFIEKFKGRADLIHSAMSRVAGLVPVSTTFFMRDTCKDAPDAAEQISVNFEKGIPVGVTNLTAKTPELTGALELFLELNKLAGKHGIGRIDIVENRFVGIKSGGCHQARGGTILRAPHSELDGFTMDREVRKVPDT